MTNEEKIKKISVVLEAGCTEECDDCFFRMYPDSWCEKIWMLDKITGIVEAK